MSVILWLMLHLQSNLRFDWSINLGHIVSFFGILLAFAAAWNSMHNEVKSHGRYIAEHQKFVEAQMGGLNDSKLAMKELVVSLNNLSNNINKLDLKIDRVDSKVDVAKDKANEATMRLGDIARKVADVERKVEYAEIDKQRRRDR